MSETEFKFGTWYPIESAPKDGRPILLWLDPALDTNDACGCATVDKLHTVVGWASDTFGRGVDWECGFCDEGAADTEGFSPTLMMTVNPTHWMTLPPPPQSG